MPYVDTLCQMVTLLFKTTLSMKEKSDQMWVWGFFHFYFIFNTKKEWNKLVYTYRELTRAPSD